MSTLQQKEYKQVDKKSLINELEETTLNRALLLLVVSLPFPLFLGIIRAVQSNVYAHLIAYFPAYCILLGTYLFRSKLSNYVKTITITSIFLLAGTVSVLTWGFVGIGPILFFTSLVFTILGRSQRLLLFWLVVVTLVVVLAAINIHTDMLFYKERFAEYSVAPVSWLIFIVVMLFLSTITTMTLFSYQIKISEMVDKFVDTGEKLQENEAALEQEQEQTSIFLDSLPGLFFLYDSNFRLIRWNGNYKRDTGYSDKELAGMSIEEWFDPKDLPLVKGAIQTIFDRGTVSVKLMLRLKDGSSVPYYFSAKVIDLDGEKGFCGHGINIAEQQMMEEQFFQNQKMEALGELAGGVAHDFNNILSGFYGFIQLAEISKNEETRQKHMYELRKLVDRAKELVGQILSFSRSDSYTSEVVSLSKLLDDVATLINASTPSSIRKEFTIDDDTIRVLGNYTKIHQVVLNICTNSIHAMEEQAGTLSVKLTSEKVQSDSLYVRTKQLAEGVYARIDITDTGKGIPLSVQQKMFQPFFTTKKAGVGTGLGLSVVHSIVSDHNGYITYTTELGKGTTFSILLPLSSDVKKTAPVISTDDIHGSGHVLFVDDEEYAQKTVPAYLEEIGFEVTICANGKEALSCFKDSPDGFQIIISDQTMPEMSGVRFLSLVRKENETIPLILVSGLGDEMLSSEQIEDAGISKYLKKPIEPKEIAHHIVSLIQK